MKNKERNKLRLQNVLEPNTQKLSIKDVISENALNEEVKNDLKKTKELEKRQTEKI